MKILYYLTAIVFFLRCLATVVFGGSLLYLLFFGSSSNMVLTTLISGVSLFVLYAVFDIMNSYLPEDLKFNKNDDEYFW